MGEKFLSLSKLNFTGGEWSPNLYARTDLAKYPNAVRTMKNFFPHPHGPVSNRPGTKFIHEVKDSSKKVRLIPFQFNTEQKYLLEFGEEYMRVYMDDGLVEESQDAGTNLVIGTAYEWVASGSGTNEYYVQLSGGGDPGLDEPEQVYRKVGSDSGAVEMTEGTIGSLALDEWGYGDNDTLGFSTIYVRLPDGGDPDDESADSIRAIYIPAVGSGIDIVVDGVYKWERYFSGNAHTYRLMTITSGDPGLDEPVVVYEDVGGADTLLTKVSDEDALDPGEWAWGYYTAGKFYTIYIRLSDQTDPESHPDGYCEACGNQDPDEGTSLVIRLDYKWLASGSGTNEYYVVTYAEDDPGLDDPLHLYINEALATEGTLGSLAAGEWGYGDNDSLGYNTIYVRLSDGTDPDTKDVGYIEACYIEELVTPYLEDDLFDLCYIQSADVLYVTHPSYTPRKITRSAHDQWSIEIPTFGSSVDKPTGLQVAGTGAYYRITAVSGTGEESERSVKNEGAANNTLTWNPVDGAAYYNVYKDRDLSDMFGWIGYAIDETFKEPSATITPDFAKAPPKARSPFGSLNNYPGICCFFEQRLLYARTNNAPQSIFGSVTGHFDNYNYATPIQDDDAFTFTINSLQINEIVWVIPMSGLIIGTTGGEYRMTSGGSSDAVTPSSKLIKKQSEWGSARMQPIVIGATLLFVSNAQNVIRDMAYDLNIDGYAGNDLTILARHLFAGYSIVDWAYQRDPDSVIWCVRNDGTLLGLTYYKEHEVWGWHRNTTEGSFEAVACLGTEDGVGQVYFVVNRTIDGSTVRYVEKMAERLSQNSDNEYDVQDAFFVDCGLSLDSPVTITGATTADPVVITAVAHGFSNGDEVDIVQVQGMTELNGGRFTVANKTDDTFELTDEDGSEYTAYVSGGVARKAVTTISGLDHLEGETVAILANGFVVEDKTVSGGAITLDSKASRVHVGLSYTSELETLDFHHGDATETLQDRNRQVNAVFISLDKTRALQIAPDNETAMIDYSFRTDEGLGEPTALFTGEKDITLHPGKSAMAARVYIKNDEPVPITVNGIIAKVSFGD